MGIFKGSKYREVPGLGVDQRILDRIHKVPGNELQIWFEAALGGAGLAYDAWLDETAPEEEVQLALAALNAIWTEMAERGPGANRKLNIPLP